MKNLFLLNRSGMSPEVTCRKGRHAIESIVSRFSVASLICLCMLTIGSGNAWGGQYTYNFADATKWYTTSAKTTNVSTGNTNNYDSFYDTNGVAWTASGASRYFSGTYFLLGKTDAYVVLPTYSGEKITSVVLHGSTGHSTNVSVNIYTTGGTAASSAQTWSTKNVDHTYNIGSDYQASTLRIQVTNNYNTQFTSVTINTEPTGGGGSCNAIDVTGGSAVILPAGSTTVSSNDWKNAGAPTAYNTAAEYSIGSGTKYCVTLTQAGDYGNSNGLQLKASAGIVSVTGITSNSGVDVEILISSGSGFSIALTGATTLTNQSSGTKTISTTSTSADLTISKTSSGAGYIKYIKVTPKAAASKVATPTFSPAAGTYNNNQSVALSCGTAGATIRYTTNGTDPTKTTGTVYSTNISVTGTTTIKAIAYKDGLTDSDVASATYTLVCANPTISPAAGSFCGSEDVTLSCTTNGATIRYTTNGNTPTESSSAYSSAIHLTSTTTIKAKAFKSGYTASAEASATYTTNPLTTMDAIYSAATNSEVSTCITFNNWIISGVSRDGKNVYLTDGTKGLIIYNSGGNSGFAVGNILSGTATCSLKKYNQSAELVGLTSSTSGLSVTTGGSVSPITVDASDISALTGVHTGCVVTTTGVCGTCNTDKQCINGAQLYNQLYLYTTPTNGTTYTVTGVYLRFGEIQEILPLSDLTTFTITAVSNNDSYGTVSVSNGVITATPESGYRVSTTTAYTISPAESATVTDNGDNTFTVTPSANTTITINFELIPTYTVTWSVSGNTTSYPATTGVVGGTTTTAPTVSPSPCGTFMGWTTAANASYSDPSNPPSPLFTGTTPAITDNVTFYAVFADEDE